MKEKREEEKCQKCDRPRGDSRNAKICQRCISSLPYCKCCTMVCGAEKWDFVFEKKAFIFIHKKTNEEIVLCGTCKEKLMKTDSLRPEHGKLKREELVFVKKIEPD